MQRDWIMTVRGPIPSEELGFCHSHEHLFMSDGHWTRVNSALRLDSFESTLLELGLFKRAGGRSVVDAQPVGCGRMADLLLRASSKSQVNVIAATGFHKLVFYPNDHWIHTISEEKLSEIFQDELEKGMYLEGNVSIPSKRTTIRAGVIKVASDSDGITEENRRLFFAAARVAKQTGASILSHTEAGRGALEQIDLFLQMGLSPESIIICHMDRSLENFDYHVAVAQTGVYLEYDTIGRFKYHSDDAEAEHILRMVERGFEDRILLGLDVTRERMKAYGGAPGLDHIITSFVPLLKEVGITEGTIKKFTVHNPAQAFRIKNT